ncbi:MAG: LysR family transcriptional regulator [Firmicutes bacterium]|nr:LysR family transcriptional regulator [Bacillota bacterium]
MDIRHIMTFLRVVDRKNFSKAAEDLAYAQSTVTYQIKQLENELGFPLLDRSGPNLSLTAPGREFLPLAEKIVRLQQEALCLNCANTELRGTLCLGITEALVADTLVQVLPRFNRLYPQVDVHVMSGRRLELLDWLRTKRLDLVYLTGPDDDDPELQCCYKRRERLIFVASSQHPLARHDLVLPQECLVYPYLDVDRSGYCYSVFKKMASECGLSLRQYTVLDNTQAVAEILRSNTAFSYLPEYSVKKEIDAGHLTELNVALEPAYYYSRILYRRNKWIPAFMEDLIRMIREHRPDDPR